jgi:hypothetical protein
MVVGCSYLGVPAFALWHLPAHLELVNDRNHVQYAASFISQTRRGLEQVEAIDCHEIENEDAETKTYMLPP